MPKDERLKSAYELAMEQLRAEDKKKGLGSTKPLTETQRVEMARLRSEAQAKLAELEILHKKNIDGVREPAELEKLERNYQIDRRRVESHLESAIERLRRDRD